LAPRQQGYLVARELDDGTVVRGRVNAFDTTACRHSLLYTDEFEETVNLDVLNTRGGTSTTTARAAPARVALNRRCRTLARTGSLEDGVPPCITSCDEEWVQQLLNGIKEGWRADRLKYDIRHFMANFSVMVATDKASYLFRLFICYVSDAIYKMLPNETDRVRDHMVQRGMGAEEICRAARSYSWRMARYSCPEPAIILRGLIDIFSFFKDMDDLGTPSSSQTQRLSSSRSAAT